MIQVLFITLIVVVDQVSKYIVAHNLVRDITVIPHFFYITYVENTGMAWSLLSGQQAFLCIVAAVAIGVMIWYMITRNPSKLMRVALCLMIAGAAGNLLDRLILGVVRDFLDFYIFGYNFPVFNIADVSLCIGVALLIIATIKDDESLHQKNKLDKEDE